MCRVRPERRDKGLDPCTAHGSLLANRLPQTRASHPISKAGSTKPSSIKRLWHLRRLVVLRNRSLVLERYFEDEIVGTALARSSASHSRRARCMICVRAQKASLPSAAKAPPPEAALFSAFPKYADGADKDGSDRLSIEHVLMGTDRTRRSPETQGSDDFRSPPCTITAPLPSHCPRWCFTFATCSIASLCLLKQARYQPTPGRARSISSSAACVTKTATSVVPSSIAKRTPRMVSHAGLPTDERLIASLLAARQNLRFDGRPFLQAAQEFLFCHHVNGRVA
jgi:hypothetical protein